MNKKIKRKKFNISLLGESEVGKTRITNAYLGKEIEEVNLTTIGIDNYMDTAQFEGNEYKFKIYDTAGQERYRSISKSTIKITDGFLLVFSVGNRESFNLINYWFDSIKEVVDIRKKVIFLVGNKIDLTEREVSNEEAMNFSKMKNVKYFETSAKTNCGIKEVFQQLYKDIFDLYKANKETNEKENDNIRIDKKNKNDNKTEKKSRC